MMTKFQFEKNGFDLIRYWAALSVMLLHFTGYGLMVGSSGREMLWGLRQIVSFFPGVVVLFSLSGYLVSASMERLGSRKLFFKKRVLRLYPELWLCTIINVLVLALLVPELLDKSMVVWFFTQIVGIANTPACLDGFATGSVNGALWTICVEIQLYIVLGLGYRRLKKLNNSKWCMVLTGCVLLNIAFDLCTGNPEGIIPKLIERSFLPYLLWFLIGVFCYVKKEWFWERRKIVAGLICLYCILYLLPMKLPGYYANIAIGVLCPFIVIMGGYCLPPVRLKVDITYGLFLYHWIVLNIMIHFGMLQKVNWFICLIVFLAGSVFLAWASSCLCRNFIAKTVKDKRGQRGYGQSI